MDPRLHICGKHTRLINGRMTTLSCSRSWFCPYCFEKQMGPKRQKLTSAMLTWAQAGGEHALITLAVPHGRLSPLAPLIEDVTQWRERLFSRDQRQAKKWEEYNDCGVVEVAFWGLEVVRRKGWHPHVHLIARLDPGTTDKDIARFKKCLIDSIPGLRERQKRRNAFKAIDVRLVKPDTEEKVARYVTKGSHGLVDTLMPNRNPSRNPAKAFVAMVRAYRLLREYYWATFNITSSRLSAPTHAVPQPLTGQDTEPQAAAESGSHDDDTTVDNSAEEPQQTGTTADCTDPEGTTVADRRRQLHWRARGRCRSLSDWVAVVAPRRVISRVAGSFRPLRVAVRILNRWRL